MSMHRAGYLALLTVLAATGCADMLAQDRAIKVYPRPARDTIAAVNLALRDLNFFPTDVVLSHPNPRLTFVTTAYREESLGEIVYIAVRELEGERSQVEVLTRGDVTGAWTWTIWWPPLIFDQTNRRLFTLASSPPTLVPIPPAPGRTLPY
jgi:hypothetical protein